MNSMTGYGKGVAERHDRKITIELKSVNHRYLDMCFKLPRGLNFLEECLRKEIQKQISRGHIEIYCVYEDNREGKNKISIDTVAAKQYFDIGIKLQEMGFVNDITASQVLKLPEVLITQDAEDDEQQIKEIALEAAAQALDNLKQMRKNEGRALAKDIRTKLASMQRILNRIKEKAPFVCEEYRVKLKQRITEILKEIEPDETRLLNEVAYFADKSSIDEELTRLFSHIEQGRKILRQKKRGGAPIGFLVQEMNREANTIGSKSNDLFITRNVLELKGEIEKIREQTQNIE